MRCPVFTRWFGIPLFVFFLFLLIAIEIKNKIPCIKPRDVRIKIAYFVLCSQLIIQNKLVLLKFVYKERL